MNSCIKTTTCHLTLVVGVAVVVCVCVCVLSARLCVRVSTDGPGARAGLLGAGRLLTIVILLRKINFALINTIY